MVKLLVEAGTNVVWKYNASRVPHDDRIMSVNLAFMNVTRLLKLDSDGGFLFTHPNVDANRSLGIVHQTKISELLHGIIHDLLSDQLDAGILKVHQHVLTTHLQTAVMLSILMQHGDNLTMVRQTVLALFALIVHMRSDEVY
jgi:hypothetical protein